MENAVDALKIAASVLLFIIALSVAIISYGQVRETVDNVLEIHDRETEYIDGNFYYNPGENDEKLVRTVGLETIIPTIYRVYYENYRIYFEFPNGDKNPIYTNISNNLEEKRFSLDLEYETKIARSSSKEKVNLLLNAIVYGKKPEEYDKVFKTRIELPTSSLVERLKGKKITEHLGEYYQNDNPNTPESNKIKKRVITYKIEN